MADMDAEQDPRPAHAPAPSPVPVPLHRFGWLIGTALALVAAGALAAALSLEGPAAPDSPYLTATAPALPAGTTRLGDGRP